MTNRLSFAPKKFIGQGDLQIPNWINYFQKQSNCLKLGEKHVVTESGEKKENLNRVNSLSQTNS